MHNNKNLLSFYLNEKEKIEIESNDITRTMDYNYEAPIILLLNNEKIILSHDLIRDNLYILQNRLQKALSENLILSTTSENVRFLINLKCPVLS